VARRETTRRFRHRLVSDAMTTYAWRLGPISGLRCTFGFGGRVDSLHIGRLAVGRGGQDPISEGFREGTKVWWLKDSYPSIALSWWPSAADMLRDELEVVQRRRARARRREVAARKQRDAIRDAASELVDACGPLAPNMTVTLERWKAVDAAWQKTRDAIAAVGGSTGGETP
jgi:hypothetical protein